MKFILEFLNKSNFFPYYIITPLPYAIGTAAHNILFGINKANQKKKKTNNHCSYNISKVLKLFSL